MFDRLKNSFKGYSLFSWLLILLGSLSWSLTMVKSGLKYSYGMGFWGPNGHDGIWHIALSESLARGSWQMPMFAGETIKNYHIGFDLILAWISKLTLIPVHTLYFQILPPILALSIGVSVYKFVYIWKKSTLEAFWATFFVYFGGSFGWIVTLLRDGKIGGESMFWSQQSVSSLVNPPFAMSLVILFVGLIFLIKGIRSSSKKQLVISTFLFGILIQIKVYAGILILTSLFVAGLWRMIKRKGISLMKVFLGGAIISIILFSPMGSDAGKTVIYQPFWFLETMMGVSDRLNWPRFYQAMMAYKQGSIWLKSVVAYSLAFLIFVIGNMGMRILSVGWLWKKLRNIRKIIYIDTILVTIILTGILAPTFFVQSGTPWNTIQFMYYSLIFAGILTGIWLGSYLERVKNVNSSMYDMMIYHTKRYLLPFVLMLLTIPTTAGTLYYVYLPSRPPAKVSIEELEALGFLRAQPTGVVLTYPYDKVLADQAVGNPPRPLYLYESTAYVSAFSDKPVYLEDEVNLDITGYDWRQRHESELEFYQSLDQQFVWDFLRQNNITYVYWVDDQRATLGEDQLGIEKIYENSRVNVYKVI
jgi:hypothetical protein